MVTYKRVAIVGASGLLGKCMVRQLLKADFELTLISRDTTKLKTTFRNLNSLTFKEAESNDAASLKDAFLGKTKCSLELTFRH